MSPLKEAFKFMAFALPLALGTFILLSLFGNALSPSRRIEAAVEEALLRTDVSRCRNNPEAATYLKYAQNALDEAIEDAEGYHLRKEEGQERQIAQNFHQRWEVWKDVEPPKCMEDIHQHMVSYFRHYELAYTFRKGSWVDVALDPIHKWYIGLGADNFAITIRLISVLKAPAPVKPGPGNQLNA